MTQSMQEAPKTNSIEDAFRPAFEEISRRSTVAKEYENEEVTYFKTSSTGFQLPFELPGQNVFLVSMGTAVLAPRPKDTDRPALRVYGAFDTHEEAKEHAEVVQSIDADCSLIIVKQNEWVLMPITEEARDDSKENSKRLQKVLTSWSDRQTQLKNDFKTRVDEKDGGSEPSHQNDLPEPEEEAAIQEAEALVYKPPRRIRVGCEVRGQSVVTLCVVPNEFGECAIKLLGCFETTDDANQWSNNVACRQIIDHDVIVASCCEWLYPNGENKGTHKYRVDELQRIMDAAEANPIAVKNYKDWKRDQDKLRNDNQNMLESEAVEEDATDS